MIFKIFITFLLLFIGYVCNAQVDTIYKSKGVPVKKNTEPDFSGKKYALIIGVSTYIDKRIPTLHYAHTDAYNFYQFLKSGNAGSFDSIILLRNESASYSEVAKVLIFWLDNLNGKLQRGDELYIYYSGHGIIPKTKVQNFICANTRFTDAANTDIAATISLDFIKDQILPFVDEAKEIKVFLIFDACRKEEVLFGNSYSYPENAIPGAITLFSASNDQFSYETDKLGTGSGVFTFFYLLGIKGAADEDNNNEVTLGELENFIKVNVANYAQKNLKVRQYPFVKPRSDNDRDHVVMSRLTSDTVKKYKKEYQILKTNFLTSKGFDFKTYNYLAQKSIYSNCPFQDGITTLEHSENINTPVFSDTTGLFIYNRMLEAIEHKDLIMPAEKSALKFYEALNSKKYSTEIREQAKEKLFVALLGKSQDVIDTYLTGRLRKTTKEVFDLAFDELNTAKNLLPDHHSYAETMTPKLYFLKARALSSSNDPKDWNKALHIIDSAISISPKAYSYHTKARVYKSKGNEYKALEYYKKASELAPSWVYPVYGVASIYFDVGEYDKSIKYCKKAIEKDSTYAAPYGLIGLNFENVKMYDSAYYWYRKGLDVDSTENSLYYRLGNLFGAEEFKNKNKDSANFYLTKGAFSYSDADCFNLLGTRFYNVKKYDSAAYYYKKALAINPYYQKTIENYVYLLDNTGKKEQADLFFRQKIKDSDNDPDLLSDYRWYIFQTKPAEVADSLFEELMKINNENPYYFIQHADQWKNKGDSKKARNILWAGLKDIKDNPALLDALGSFYFNNSTDSLFQTFALDSALYYYKKSCSINPEYAFVHLNLYHTYLLLGYVDSALSSLKVARNQNKYIEQITSTTNYDLLAFGEKELRSKNFARALSIFRMADNPIKPSFEANYKTSMCFYLMQRFDSAYERVQKLDDLTRDKNQVMNAKQLKALILFDLGNYTEANTIFKYIDDNLNPLPDFAGEILCLFKLGKTTDALNLLAVSKENSTDSFADIIKQEGIKYSANFINIIKQFKNEKK